MKNFETAIEIAVWAVLKELGIGALKATSMFKSAQRGKQLKKAA